MTMTNEHVFGVPTSIFRRVFSYEVPGFYKVDINDLMAVLLKHGEFRDREEAETDKGFKQAIPYVVLVDQMDRLFSVSRLGSQSEKRLHGKTSIGIGGHINPVDDASRKELIHVGALRELNEELSIHPSPKTAGRIVGVVNDDSNDVGAVHFGVVFELRIDRTTEVKVRETGKMTGTWRSVDELVPANIETWTRLCIEGWHG